LGDKMNRGYDYYCRYVFILFVCKYDFFGFAEKYI